MPRYDLDKPLTLRDLVEARDAVIEERRTASPKARRYDSPAPTLRAIMDYMTEEYPTDFVRVRFGEHQYTTYLYKHDGQRMKVGDIAVVPPNSASSAPVLAVVVEVDAKPPTSTNGIVVHKLEHLASEQARAKFPALRLDNNE